MKLGVLLILAVELLGCSRSEQTLKAEPAAFITLSGSEILRWGEGHFVEWAGRYGVGGRFMLIAAEDGDVVRSVVTAPGLDAGFIVVALRCRPIESNAARIEFESFDPDGGKTTLGFWAVGRGPDGGLTELRLGASGN